MGKQSCARRVIRNDRRRQLLLALAWRNANSGLSNPTHDLYVFLASLSPFSALLQLWNTDGDASDVSAYVSKELQPSSSAAQVAHLLSVALNNKTSYVRNELYDIIFNA